MVESNNNASTFSLSEISQNYENGNYYVWNQSAFNTHITTTGGREAWINRTQVFAGRDNWINASGLQPATIYTICGYYQNTNKSVSSSQANCSQFYTYNATWPIYRAVLNFSRHLSNTERNKLLCYIKSVVNPTQNRYLTNLRSESCNSTNTTAREWYNYSGDTNSINSTEVIYLLTQDNGTQSQATTNFINMFDSNTNNTVSTTSSAISSATGVTLISGKYDGSSAVSQMKLSNRTIFFVKPTYSGNTVTISNMTLRGGHGVVYMGVSPTSNSKSTPTVEQLINCVNGNSTSGFTNCTRLTFASGQTSSVTFPNLGSPPYNLYTVATNDYPVRPIPISSNVTSVTGIGSSSAFSARVLMTFFLLSVLLALL